MLIGGGGGGEEDGAEEITETFGRHLLCLVTC